MRNPIGDRLREYAKDAQAYLEADLMRIAAQVDQDVSVMICEERLEWERTIPALQQKPTRVVIELGC